MKRFLAEYSPPLVAALIRALAWTIRFRLEDPDRILQQEEREPRIFVFWHNRIPVVPFQLWTRILCLEIQIQNYQILVKVILFFLF